MKRLLAVLAAGAIALTGCSPAAGGNQAAETPETESVETVEAVPAEAVIIDVRTPDEYAAGHLDGAENVDLQGADFASAIGQYAADGAYIVYCRSGNRSATATAVMQELGFTDVTDLGSMENASSVTGVQIVQ